MSLYLSGECSLVELGCILLLSVILFEAATKLKLFVVPELMENMIKKCGVHFADSLYYSQDDGIPEKYFKEAGFIKKYTSYYSGNFICGKFNNKDFIISDIVVKNKISTSQKNEDAVLFNGVFCITDFINKKRLFGQ